MGQIALQIPQTGQPNATEDVKVANDFTTLQTWANGNVDATNIAAALAQSAAVNQNAQTVKGAVNIAASESRTNVAYGALTTPDQVTGIVLPSNGLIAVWYQATWQESVSAAARAALFIGANQLVVARTGAATPVAQAAAFGATGVANLNVPLVSFPLGLASHDNSGGLAGSTDATTGQAVGMFPDQAAGLNFDVGGTVESMPANMPLGGPCFIFAAAGTYTISVQFKASSGSVTASNRKLWVQALSFA